MGHFNNMKNVIHNTIISLKRNKMDFYGQKLAFLIKNIIFTISTIISIAIGYYKQDIALSAYILLGATVLCSILVIPTWPVYYKNNIQWTKSEDSLKKKKEK
ncbi:microsomal signal peptidase protein, putative [Hepatocystis sp. ex Piliocolobus tephrosceles]|nr:microsomal signal peptidase protein, putative [Hepatocystis sp. ex Piliocolobus tephrosceles]